MSAEKNGKVAIVTVASRRIGGSIAQGPGQPARAVSSYVCHAPTNEQTRQLSEDGSTISEPAVRINGKLSLCY
jgi:hypothetical protein